MDASKVDKAFEAIDDVFVAKMNELDLSFEEIETVIYRLKEKVFQAKLDAYLLFKSDTKGNSIYG